ncbi:putative DNA alkylation repair enzyme [Solitalea canadensis DSM 3403]|uniref:Putative DNA alkylation repair enzyme n=2 Tax=Solitalea canadensis TaxID=995 RepID=H8KVA3_SOLCM|nr:putative DNA alkylation repair enzyme [Solitalea canadensis DSM 3403]
MEDLISNIRQALKDGVDENTQKNSQRFFKEKINSYGVKVPVVQKIAKEFFSYLKAKSKAEIFTLCEALWQSGYMEESFIACEWSYKLKKEFEPDDLLTFERWINSYVSNWASCDTFCNHTVGSFIEQYPESVNKLKSWAVSDNRWMKRAAAVSLIIPARKGLFLNEIFSIADTLLHDKDDLVQKGYGWMLKAASQAHEKEVFKYVISKKTTMPRTALRYAIEKIPKELKTIAMAK